MFLPLFSDSPMRVWPFATGALILLNVVCFVIQHSLPDREIRMKINSTNLPPAARVEFEELRDDGGRISIQAPGYVPYTLYHGDGLHPIQWFTSFFMHAGIGHLLGNMLFLWVFGQVVEGVVRHGFFVLLYLGMGLTQNIIEQVLFLGSDGGTSLGASSAIYSIMLLAAWFAPQDNIHSVIFFFYRVFFFPIPVLMMALFYFLFDVAHSAASGFEMNTPLLHALGGVVGLVTGFVLLKGGLVENDHRDALSLMEGMWGAQPKSKKQKRLTKLTKEQLAAKEAELQARIEQLRIAENSLSMHLQAGNLTSSLAQYHRLKKLDPKFDWQESQLRKLISLAQQNSDWSNTVSLSQQYLDKFKSDNQQTATVIRLNLATVFLQKLDAPQKARRLLNSIDQRGLSKDQVQLHQRLLTKCEKQIDEGGLELADD